MNHRRLRTLGLIFFAACTGDLTNQGGNEMPPPPPPTEPAMAAMAGDTAYVIAAGDIAGCPAGYQDEATAAIITQYPDARVLTLGDNAYVDGTAAEYNTCYHASWGAFKDRTHPVPGNHEYHTVGATGYYGYFGSAAGDPNKGYYTYDVGTWRIYALNSEISVSSTSGQLAWLKADLAARPAQCILAYWHRPLFTSSAVHAGKPGLKYIWSALQAAGAEVVLSAHNHHYERFAPQTADSVASFTGIREFVVGGGGNANLYNFLATPARNSEAQYKGHGVLLLGLYPGGYTWKHLALPGATFTDAGSGACTGAADPPPPPPPSPISLTVSGRSDATKQYMTLDWTGALGASVDVYRNGTRITTTANDGHYTNSRTFQGAATYTYKVCEVGSSKCSNEATVSFGGDPPPPPPPPPSSITLSATGRYEAGTQYMTLRWTGASGTTVDVYRNGTRITNTLNDGYYVNSRTFQGPITYVYKVCQAGSTVCSNEATVTFS